MRPPKRTMLPLLLSLPVCLSAVGDGMSAAAPEEAGLSGERLERLTNAMNAHVEAGHFTGAVAAIAREGKIVYFETYGDQDREADVPMADDTIFRIYSMTKAITGVAVMMLYEEGHFTLNDPVAKYLPTLHARKVAIENEEDTGSMRKRRRREKSKEKVLETVPAKRQMTIRDLLRHTSGITYGDRGTKTGHLYEKADVNSKKITIEEMVERLGAIPLESQPGTRWQYGLSIDVLGRLVEVVSGMPLDQFLETRIFAPLGMKDTAFHVPEEKHARLVKLYAPAPKHQVKLSTASAQDEYLTKPIRLRGGGGLVSTAMDYLRFCQTLLNNGELEGTRILGRKSVELMRMNHMGDILDNGRSWLERGAGFGLTFAVNLDPGLNGELGSVGEYNWSGAAGTAFWIDPVEKLTGVFMINILPYKGPNYGAEFKRFAYQAIVD